MLKCRDVAHEASDYIDHNLTGWQRFWFNVHLFMCANCRKFVNHVHITRDFIRNRGVNSASKDEVQRVMKAVEQDKP
jgi:hypothetical protein